MFSIAPNNKCCNLTRRKSNAIYSADMIAQIHFCNFVQFYAITLHRAVKRQKFVYCLMQNSLFAIDNCIIFWLSIAVVLFSVLI